MADKLSTYNLALTHLGERTLASLTESNESRRTFDNIWNQTFQEALEEAPWKFMIRTVQMDASTTVIPGFGWKYAFIMPVDWVRSDILSTIETFVNPLLDYATETGYIYANFTPLYMRYVSNDTLYGNNLGKWPANFTSWVSFLLAVKGCKKITGAEPGEFLFKRGEKAKRKAKEIDAWNDPPQQIASGTWVRSRRGFLRGVPLPGGTMFDD